MEEFDFESIKNKSLEQLKYSKSLLGKDGTFTPLLVSLCILTVLVLPLSTS
jgi:hypothetical protein